MKTIKILRKGLIFSLALFIISFAGCKEDNNTNNEPQITNPYGSVTKFSDCKGFIAGRDDGSEFAVIDYNYDGVGTLTLKHINAGFNCCPGILSATFKIIDGVITIIEKEEKADCRCNCLYDMDMVINDLAPGKYRIVIIEPYLHPDNPVLDFTVDFSKAITGEFKVARQGYPWHD